MKVLTLEALRDKGISYSRTHLKRLIDSGKFPKPARFTDDVRTSRLFWSEKEIDAWLKSRLAARDQQQPA